VSEQKFKYVTRMCSGQNLIDTWADYLPQELPADEMMRRARVVLRAWWPLRDGEPTPLIEAPREIPDNVTIAGNGKTVRWDISQERASLASEREAANSLIDASASKFAVGVARATFVPFRDVRLESGYAPQSNRCHQNVTLWIAENPTFKAVRGWLSHGDLLFDKHTVVRDSDGGLFDITPLAHPTKFFEDTTGVWDELPAQVNLAMPTLI
jgi:hypothetical protein